MVITRVAPLSFAKVAAVLYLVFGLIAGGIISLASLAGAFASGSDDGAFIGAMFGVGAVIILPICYAFFGFIGTLLMAWLFNIAAGVTGGVEIDAR